MPQVLLTVYFMESMPAATPETEPEELTVAILLVTLLHVPPPTVSLSAVVPAWQTVEAPEIVPAFGNGLTVKVVVAAATPQLLETV